MQVAFFCCFRQGVAGISRDLGRDVPDLEKLYARKLWADFSYPITGLGGEFLHPFPKSLVTGKYYSNKKKWPLIAVNSR